MKHNQTQRKTKRRPHFQIWKVEKGISCNKLVKIPKIEEGGEGEEDEKEEEKEKEEEDEEEGGGQGGKRGRWNHGRKSST